MRFMEARWSSFGWIAGDGKTPMNALRPKSAAAGGLGKAKNTTLPIL